MDSKFYSRRRHSIFWLFMLGIPLVLWGVWWALQSNSNRVEDWLPEDFDETQQLHWFAAHFGGDELLMISWPGCTLDDPRVAQFAAKLRLPPEKGIAAPANSSWTDQLWRLLTVERRKRELPLFGRVVTGQEAVEELRDVLPNASRTQALERLRGWIVGKDDPEKTCVLAMISYEGGVIDRHAALDYVYHCAGQVSGLSPDEIHVAGTTMESVAIDRASGDFLLPLNSASYAVCFLIMLISFRSIWLSLLLFSNALFCQLLAVSLVHYLGGQMDSVLLMVPSLLYVLSISAGVHLINYYRDAIDEDGLEGAPARAVGYAIAPCSLAAATTSLGLISLMVSKLVPIRNFGFYAAIAVLCGTAVLLMLLPWQVEQFPPRRWARRKPKFTSGRIWTSAASLIHKTHWAVGIFGVLLLVAGGVGILGINVAGKSIGGISASARLHDMFSPGAKVLQDYDWLEQEIGPLIPIELVAHVPVRDDEHRYDNLVERIKLIDRLSQEVQQVDGVGVAASAATFLPPLPEGAGLRYVIRRRVLLANLKEQENRERLIGLKFLVEEPHTELWRISARVNAGDKVDYSQLVADLGPRIKPLLNQAAAEGIPGVQITITGGVPVVHKAQDQLLKDLIWSFGCAFGLIAVAMIVLFSFSGNASVDELESRDARPDGVVVVTRNVVAGLLCMIPNLLPAVLVFGVMGLVGIQIEVGTMLTASAALGIAVDDTLHYVTWFRRGLSEGLDRRQAIEFAYRRCGSAMIQTTAICGLGLLMFSFSPFGPISRFAWMMFSMLTAALVGDLVVLPALLVGPFGRFFEPLRAPVPQAECEPLAAASRSAS
ncbi:MAG: MMPL family transporter [Pirellulaceae bacterium]